MDNPIFKDAMKVFNHAIKIGVLSDDSKKHNFAGNYMYMHSEQDGSDHFKHIDTRKYIVVKKGLPWTKE